MTTRTIYPTGIATGNTSDTDIVQNAISGTRTYGQIIANHTTWATNEYGLGSAVVDQAVYNQINVGDYIAPASSGALFMVSSKLLVEEAYTLYFFNTAQWALPSGTNAPLYKVTNPQGSTTVTTYADPLPMYSTLELVNHKNGETEITPWALYKPWTEGCPTAFARSAGYLDTTLPPGDELNGGGVENFRSSTVAIGIDSREITIKGVEMGVVGKTKIHGIADWDDGDTEVLAAIGFGFVYGGPNQVSFENLAFDGFGTAVYGYGPASFTDCTADHCGQAFHCFVDNRYEGGLSFIDCSATNSVEPVLAIGDNITIRGCDFHGFDATMATALATYGGAAPSVFGWAADALNYWGWPLDLRRHTNLVFDDCTIDFTGSIDFSWAAFNMLVGYSDGVTIENGMISNIRVTSYSSYWAICEFVGSNGGSVDGNTLTDCTFTGCSGFAIVVADGAGPGLSPTNNLITENAFVTCTGLGIYLLNASSCQLVHNDYRNSGFHTNIADIFASAVVLDGCDHCTVKETGRFPVGHGGAKNFVSDINGYSNRIVGTPANKVERPAGIGNLKRALTQQKHTEVLATAKKHAKRWGR